MSLLTVPATRAYEPLTKAWTPLRMSEDQAAYLTSPALINVIVAGRRSLKTHNLKLRTVRASLADQAYDDAEYRLGAPTYQQAKNIFWGDVKKLMPDWAYRSFRKRESISESELRIELWNGASLQVVGLDQASRIEGKFWDGGGLTESGNVKEGVIEENIIPMMMRGGWLDAEGVPEGQNHFYRFAQMVRSQAIAGNPDYAYHHWRTDDVLWLWLGVEKAARRLAMARSAMDELTYRQEFGAEFISPEGAVYYNFDEKKHVRRDVMYWPSLPLVLCFDFNVSPGVALVCQEQFDRETGEEYTACLDEVFIERNSNTPRVCQALKKKLEFHKNKEVKLYGDATGGAGKTAAVNGSDWDLVKAYLRTMFDITDNVRRSNPPPRVTTTAVNSRLLTAAGTSHVRIDGKRCPMLIRDLSTVKYKKKSWDIDGETDKMLTHISDAFRYYVYEQHPVLPSEFIVEQM